MKEKVIVYTVKVIYKSGASMEFDVTAFKYNNGTYTWTAFGNKIQPIILGADEVVAVWQVDVREDFKK